MIFKGKENVDRYQILRVSENERGHKQLRKA